MEIEELALQRSKYKHLSDDEWRWFLQQVEGRERTADKLPTFAAISDWWYPVRLSCEQCSSEETARYKAEIVEGVRVESRKSIVDRRFVDLTGGYGVDTYFLSGLFGHTDYVEQNEELCRIATHNFSIQSSAISIHHSTAEEFLQTAGLYDLIFMDPARRDSHGGKVFRLADCTPNVVELLPVLLQHLSPEGRIMLKLSPMLDISQAVKELSADSLQWSVYVVAVKNEVKEVLLASGELRVKGMREPFITAVDLAKKEQAFRFTREEERESLLRVEGVRVEGMNGRYLYEPNAAILKAGAYKLVAERFGLHKLDVNTHLYCSAGLVEDFPGRVWKVKSEGMRVERANVMVRNYPLTAEQLKKKMRLKDGGEDFLIGARVAGRPTLFWAERV